MRTGAIRDRMSRRVSLHQLLSPDGLVAAAADEGKRMGFAIGEGAASAFEHFFLREDSENCRAAAGHQRRAGTEFMKFSLNHSEFGMGLKYGCFEVVHAGFAPIGWICQAWLVRAVQRSCGTVQRSIGFGG